MTPVRELIDSSLFLGMNSSNETTRIACKNFFVDRLKTQTTIAMSLEHIGGCDRVVWMYSREVQDAYYPFMDNLHTVMQMIRLPYQENDIKVALHDSQLQDTPMYNRLLIAYAKNRNQVLFTVDKRLSIGKHLSVCHPHFKSEQQFPNFLEELYQKSLALRIPDSLLTSEHYHDCEELVNACKLHRSLFGNAPNWLHTTCDRDTANPMGS